MNIIPRSVQILSLGLVAVVLVTLQSTARAFDVDDVPVYRVEVVTSYPHDPTAFTQGLTIVDSTLYESTGVRGQSTIRRVAMKTGQTEQFVRLDRGLFGEGLTGWDDQLIMLTWEAGQAIVCDRATFQYRKSFAYSGEGWGITSDPTQLIMSDGTATLRFLDPKTFRVTRRVRVTHRGQAVTKLNELEYIGGLIFANVWQSDMIIVIDPKSGRSVALLDLRNVYPARNRHDPIDDVLNGIAFDSKLKKLYVTGKRWPRLYEIRLRDPKTGQAVAADQIGQLADQE